MKVQAGPIVLMGSGETAPNAHKVYHRLFSRLKDGVRVAILETPAGFEPNSDYVAGQVGRYLEKQLQNFRPAVTVIPARKRGTSASPDDPALAGQLYDANVAFMGPGSPSYLVRQLADSRTWHTLQAVHRLGAALVFASAGTLAMGSHTLPVYEIYKVGEDLHWKRGLNLFGDWGLEVVFVSHWNNQDGGAVLDTSRCYLGQARFAQLLELLPPDPARRIVGIDENTALLFDPGHARGSVLGAGGVTILHGAETHRYASGEHFPLALLGDFHLPAAGAGIPEAVWADTVVGVAQAAARRRARLQPEPAVLALVAERAAARSAQDWRRSDELRDQIAARGWRVLDTPDGAQLEALPEIR
jgi:cyanophycinase-like exopeptidase